MRLAALASLLLVGPAGARDPDIRRATVQISVVTRAPDYAAPWQYARQQSSAGSGVVLEGRRILTNAHVVANAAYVSVRKSGDVRNYPARVAFVAHDGETAMLTVDEPSFFDGTSAAKLGGVPFPSDKVAVYGYPIGGTEMSVTEGVVSRVGVTPYSHSGRQLLAIQTDAAINAGNSGGPVFQDGKLVGIAFQHRSDPGAQNISYMVPMPIVRRFLRDVEDKSYDGIPELGVWWQETESDSLRRSLGVPEGSAGVLITKTAFGGSAWGALLEGDVLLSLDGTRIGADGTIPFREDERIDFSDLVSRRQAGETLDALVIRAGRPVTVSVPLKPSADLVPGPRHDVRPTYLVVGGCVFMPLSDDLIGSRGGGFRVRSLSFDGAPTPERVEVAVLSHVLAHDVNRGYHSLSMAPVTRVNGRAIGRFSDLVEAFKHPLNGRHDVELDHFSGYGDNKGARIVLDAGASSKAMPEIMTRYGLPADRSDDLKPPKTP